MYENIGRGSIEDRVLIASKFEVLAKAVDLVYCKRPNNKKLKQLKEVFATVEKARGVGDLDCEQMLEAIYKLVGM